MHIVGSDDLLNGKVNGEKKMTNRQLMRYTLFSCIGNYYQNENYMRMRDLKQYLEIDKSFEKVLNFTQ